MKKESTISKENRKFGFIVGPVLGLIALYKYPAGHTMYLWLAGIASVIIVLAIIEPVWLYYPRLLWEKAGYYLALINTKILLCLVYFFVLVPLGVILRLLGKDPLERKFRADTRSYWQTRDRGESSFLKNQF